jgi:hypothetical protein
MRKVALILLLILALGVASISVAAPPESDPTCDNPGGPASGQECAGDNGAPGCEGINRAEDTPADEEAPDAFDLVTDILDVGDKGECD